MSKVLAELNVKCPLCHAPAGFPCGNESHPERKSLWNEKSGVTLADRRYDREQEELERLKHLEHEVEEIEEVVERIDRRLAPRLTFIKIAFGGNMPGPVTLTVGQKTTASVAGFDQNGAPFAIDFTANPVTWTLDNTTLDSSTPQPDQTDVIASLAAGTANLNAACAGFTDTEQVINVAQAPVLSSIKIDFSPPA